MEGLELICFEIISSVGMARSLYIEAIQEAKTGNFEQAQELIKQGDESFTEGHHSHAKLIQQEAGGEATQMTLLLTHAEDQTTEEGVSFKYEGKTGIKLAFHVNTEDLDKACAIAKKTIKATPIGSVMYFQVTTK